MIKEIIKNRIGFGNTLKLKNIRNPFKLEEIIIDVSASCNAECPFCPRVFMPEERSSGFMTLDLYEKILNDAKSNNINKLRLYSTAEPTLHPKFDKIIDLAKEKGFEISLSTNGSLLHKHKESIAKVDLLQYSIEGWDKESYEKYRFPLKFDKIFKNVKLFHEYLLKEKKTVKISTNLIITEKTDIKKYIELWGKYIGDVKIQFMYNPIKFEDGKFRAKNLDTDNEYFSLNKQKKDFYCPYPFTVLTVAYDGKVALCCNDFSAELDIGSLANASIKEVYQNQILKSARNQFYSQKLDICKECSGFSQPNEDDIRLIKNKIDSLEKNMTSKILFNY